MSFITFILKRIQRWRIARLRKQGLQIADDCRLEGTPFFGSEPFLISIGKHVTISGKVTFITHDGGTWVFREQPRYTKVHKFGRITIHDNCFIGFGAILMPGVSVGPNSVVAAGAVVTRDVPPNSVAAGVPAKVLGTVEQYAEKSLANTPETDEARYASDKRGELLRQFPYPW